MGVGLITNAKLSKEISKSYKTSPIVLWKVDENAGNKKKPLASEVYTIQGSDTKEILENVLNHLPNPKLLDEGDFGVRTSQSLSPPFSSHKYFSTENTQKARGRC